MFNFFKKSPKKGSESHIQGIIRLINQRQGSVYSFHDLRENKDYINLKILPEEEIKSTILELLDESIRTRTSCAKSRDGNQYGYDYDKYDNYASSIAEALIAGLINRKLNYTENEWITLMEKVKSLQQALKKYPEYYFNISHLPMTHIIKQIEYATKKNPLSKKMESYIKDMLDWPDFKNPSSKGYWGSDMKKASKKLKLLINANEEETVFQLKSEDIGDQINTIINSIEQHQKSYYKIFHTASKVSGSKPSKKFLTQIEVEVETIGLDRFKQLVHKILHTPMTFDPYSKTTTYDHGNSTYDYTETHYLSGDSQNFVKGMVWTCSRFSDKETINLLTKLTEKCFKKIPGKGPAAASVGNACVYILGNMRGKDGLGALSRLKLKVRQNNVKKTIDKYMLTGAEKYNVSVEELKEMAVPSFGLISGTKEINFEDYQLSISAIGKKITQQWIKPDGAHMKSVPSVVKNSATLKKKLQDIRKEVKEIQKVHSAQKQRIDNQFILGRTWDLPSFNKYYIDHGLVYPIASKLIWTFSNDKQSANAILLNNEWTDLSGNKLSWIDDQTSIQLWHPVNADEETIVAWRNKMIELEWQQPIKQAYREIYLLTDAEINTRTYSNRMAAHILKQHQFSSLANIRNWKYSLMGAYDDGRDNEICSKSLPEYNMSVEYWIDELNHDDAFNDTGIWLYVSTDQVKFMDAQHRPMELMDVPKMVFTEIMRDVDLFVGVASVGNDPEWMDNNGDRQQYRDYWQSYSFGDLNEIAKTRKEILTNLLPRLKKIRDKAKIDGKFLIVNGQVRTYKIHIGSGNILMEPNDQYLCIVPSRSTASTDKLFIPFEGDRGLSIVLSKAFLLAEDSKIEDKTILSQINRK